MGGPAIQAGGRPCTKSTNPDNGVRVVRDTAGVALSWFYRRLIADGGALPDGARVSKFGLSERQNPVVQNTAGQDGRGKCPRGIYLRGRTPRGKTVGQKARGAQPRLPKIQPIVLVWDEAIRIYPHLALGVLVSAT